MAQVQSPDKGTRLQQFKDVCHKWLYIEDDSYIDVVLGAVCANKLDAKPVWMYLVGPPGAGKTDVLQACGGHFLVYALTKLTPQTLISGKILHRGEPDPSLILKLDGKVLLIRDFSAILKSRYEYLAEIISQLRDAYDGTLRNAYGTGKDKEYNAKFGIVAATTPEIDRHVRALAPLGERFLMYRMPSPSDAEIEARTLLAAENRSREQQEQELREAAHRVLDLVPGKPVIPVVPPELQREFAKLAQIVAVARTEVARDSSPWAMEIPPEPEIPTRLVEQFVTLAQGIAIARGLAAVTSGELGLVRQVGFSCITRVRWKIIMLLAETHPKPGAVEDLAETLRIACSSVRRHLDELRALDIVGVQNHPTAERQRAPDEWRLREKYAEYLCGHG